MTNQNEPPRETGVRAAVYLRISQDATGEQAGVMRQREDCLALVESQRWALHEIYVDNDISASSGKPRPDYRRMLRDIEAGHIDAVVAWHPDRLYRKLASLEELIAACEARGVIMRTVRAGEIDLSTPTGRMLARILSATAQAEGEIKADRWRRSWRQGREAGTPARTGSRLFGYTHEGQLVPHEAAIARRMVADVVSGVPIITVARWLEAEGITTTRGGVWRPGALRQYLNNPRIAGYSTLKGEIVAEGNWSPLVDRDTWETVRALMSSRARGGTANARVSLLNGLLFCGKCGHRMITSGLKSGKRTYRCPNRPGMPGCGGVSGYAEPIEEIAEAYAQERLADPRVREEILRLSSRVSPQLLGEIGALESRIAELESSLDEPGVPVATILRAIDRSKERLEECQRRLGDSSPVHIPVDGTWPTDLERRRKLVALVTERVELHPVTKPTRYFSVERVKVIGR